MILIFILLILILMILVQKKNDFIYKKENHYSQRGESLFNAIGQEKRYCNAYDNYFIDKSSCQCVLW